MHLIDTHCHFDDASFLPDRQNVLQKMERLGVKQLIIPAISASNWPSIQSLCEQHPQQCYAAYGLHPVFLDQHQGKHLKALPDWLSQPQTLAVGECGLDFYLPHLDPEKQEALFVEHLKLAKQFDLPLIIHARRSLDKILMYLRRYPGCRGIIHSFAGSQQQAELLIKMGFYLGLGGTITYERAQRLRKVAATISLDAIVLETDAPDQPDSQWRGQRNDPTRLPVIAQALADLRGSDIGTIAATTTANVQRLFPTLMARTL